MSSSHRLSFTVILWIVFLGVSRTAHAVVGGRLESGYLSAAGPGTGGVLIETGVHPEGVSNIMITAAHANVVDASDANDDGTLDISDAIYTLNYLFLGGSEPSAPFPACGLDPTVDELMCLSFEACGD